MTIIIFQTLLKIINMTYNTWTVFKVDGKQQGNPPWPSLAPIIKTEILLGQSPGLNVSWSMANPPLLAFPSNTSRKVFLMSTATWDQEDQAPHKFDCNHSMWIRSKVTNIEWEKAVTWSGCHWWWWAWYWWLGCPKKTKSPNFISQRNPLVFIG